MDPAALKEIMNAVDEAGNEISKAVNPEESPFDNFDLSQLSPANLLSTSD